MSKSSLTRLLIDLSASRALQRRLSEDPKAVADEYDLTSEEAELLEAGDDTKLKDYLGAVEPGVMIRTQFD